MAGILSRMRNRVCSHNKLSRLIISLLFFLCMTSLCWLDLDSEADHLSRSFIRRSPRLTAQSEAPPKIAFLFLTRRHLPLDFFWHTFFESADKGRYSIYIHSQPGHVFDESSTECSLFHGRQLIDSFRVRWGEASMLDAERLLIDAALEDPANQRFILLSDSCIPLYKFSFVYNYLMMSRRSFVDSFFDKKDRRYNPNMSPKIQKENWRKGSQWIVLVRSHADIVVDDVEVFPVFRKHCKKQMNWRNCIPDEHYIPTLLAMKGVEKEVERRTLTYTLWNESAARLESGWHPVTFDTSAATPKRMKEIMDINHVYYETEFRIEWCKSNSTYVPCFLFARKFSQGAGKRLLREGIFDQDDHIHSALSESLQ